MTTTSEVDEILKGPSAYAACRTTSEVELEELHVWERLEKALALSKVPGVGLAAPQIGLYIQAAVIRVPENSRTRVPAITLNLWNPCVESCADPVVFQGEGCLSYPGESWATNRYGDVLMVNGDLRKYNLNGFPAIVFQHELGHLLGRTFQDFRAYRPLLAGRNEPCPCGSGKKYKKCCLNA